MLLFWLKILVTPLLILAVSMAEKRFGQKVAGLLIGLPLTSGPISVFLATEHGASFSLKAAVGTLDGIAYGGAFCVAYALFARKWKWWQSLLPAFGAFFLGLLFLPPREMPLGATLAISLASLLLSLICIDRIADSHVETQPASLKKPVPFAFNIAIKMFVATASVTALTCIAGKLGAELSGTLSTLPVISAVLISFTHAGSGSRSAISLIRGSVSGSFIAVAFYAVVATLLSKSSLIFTYSSATVAALATGWMLSKAAIINAAPQAVKLRS